MTDDTIKDILGQLKAKNSNPWPKVIREGIRLVAVFAFLYFNASNFDETEIKSILGILLASGSISIFGEQS